MKSQMPSNMQHRFSDVPRANIERSVFDRTMTHKTTLTEAGILYPVYLDEILPGDTHKVDATMFARLATPVVPIMDNLYLDVHWFFVPSRLLWTNWQRFMGERDPNPTSSTSYTVPTLPRPAATGFVAGTLADYFGIPCGVVGADGFNVNALPFRAYALIWNQWYRDENLQNSITIPTGDGPDAITSFVLQRRGKRHDYFTSALPWLQIGTAVSLPLGTRAEVIPSGDLFAFIARKASDGTVIGSAAAVNTGADSFVESATGPTDIFMDPNTSLDANLATATAATINELRQAFQLQALAERDARGGTRYIEILRAHFNVVSPDARLQRAEFLGGSSSPIIINPVPQTSATSGSAAQGDLAAFGTVTSRNGFTKSFVEHGYVMALASVRADLTYSQGLDRMWSRSTKYDFYWPALAHLGEQSILNKEIYIQGVTANDTAVFGYQERYAEYRYKNSLITGLLRPAHATPLDFWHLSQEFSALPTLSSTFIVEDPPVERVIAVTTEPHFIFDSYIKNRSVRPMPVYGVPGFLTGRF